ncbi:MAG: carotenoid 1,2-hydratase [Acidobacteria bacterium]|nr:carotenoid 1,2-hydratase [Acidobacteriota bacterium]MBI3421914.1 carotenoid 1,2-hydratase [Acidobacteriota bacterium]
MDENVAQSKKDKSGKKKQNKFLVLLSLFFCLFCVYSRLPAQGSSAGQVNPPASAQLAGNWKQALPPYQFNFPAAHASHPEYKIEWWYYTGNLAAQGGRRFGYQLTFFRIGVERMPQNASRWAVRDLYAAHLAVTDVAGQRFRFGDKLNRAGIGWAGAETATYRVWNEDWEARQDVNGQHLLRAFEREFGLDLQLAEGKVPVAHGARGVSQKGTQPGNASHYYSLTRMPTRGTLTLNGERIPVEGASWMDHEFGTSYLEPAQLGWDWFSLQLDDGTELMLYRFRRQDGARDPLSSGTLVAANGQTTGLKFDAFALTPLREWRSDSGARYPVEWRVQIPARELELIVHAALDQQELRTEGSTGVSYWEGAIEVSGTQRGRAVTGRGYLELTGYAGQAMGAVMQ